MLLVEDELVSASALCNILRYHGFEVIHAPTVTEGFARLADKPMFVLLDLMLPDGDGSMILKHIRDQKLSIRVVVTTAVADPAWLNSVYALRPEMVMQKPIDLKRLLQCLQLPN